MKSGARNAQTEKKKLLSVREDIDPEREWFADEARKLKNDKSTVAGWFNRSSSKSKDCIKPLFPQYKTEYAEAVHKTLKTEYSAVIIENKEKQLSAKEAVDFAVRLTRLYYKNVPNLQGFSKSNMTILTQHFSSFKELVQNSITSEKFAKQCHKSLYEHLNLIFYTSHSLQVKTYAEIEKEIFTQWRTSPLLYKIRAKWYACLVEVLPLLDHEAESIFEKVILRQFRKYLGHLTYFIFQGYFRVLEGDEKKGKEWVLNKLINFTCRHIITQSTQWAKVSKFCLSKITSPKVKKAEEILSKSKTGIGSFIPPLSFKPLEQLLVTSELSFPQTSAVIRKLIKSTYTLHTIKLLTQFRESLEQELLMYQKQLIEKQLIDNFQMLDKDDFLSCLIRLLLTLDKQNPLTLAATLKGSLNVFNLVFGENADEILSQNKCASYFADLEVVTELIINETEKLLPEQSKPLSVQNLM